MSPERWRQVEDVFQLCLERPPAERSAVLREVVGDDAELRREVESLLRAHVHAENFRPAGDAVRPMIEALETEYYLGRVLGRYRIEAFVARGSTGSVYRAVDTGSNEAVAVKVIAPELLADEGSLDRIRERVGVVSAIRHPNIAAVRGLEVVDGVALVVMEFVDGQRIARRSGGPGAIATAWRVASALRAIHRAGTAHGDVRPSNVMVDSAGRVKLVDFNHAGGAPDADWAQFRALVASLLAPGHWLSLAALAGVAAVAAASANWRTATAPAVETQLTFDAGLTSTPAASNDGKWLAYASDRARNGGLDIWMQPYPRGAARQITSHEADEQFPHFSPDGRWIVYQSGRDGEGVYRRSVDLGEEQRLASQGRRPRYSPDGKWIAYHVGGDSRHVRKSVFVIPAAGGSPVPVAASLESAWNAVWSPDSRALLIAGRQAGEDRAALWLASIGDGRLTRVELAGFRLDGVEIVAFRLLPDEWRDDTLYFTYFAGPTTALMAAKISGHMLLGPPRVLASGGGLITHPARMPGGEVVYSVTDKRFSAWVQPVTPSLQASGPLTPVELTEGLTLYPSLSPAGNFLLMSYWTPAETRLTLRDLAEGRDTPLATMPGRSWARFLDGGRVAYFEDRTGARVVLTGAIDTGATARLAAVSEPPWDVSADGRRILVSSDTSPERVLVDGEGGARVLLDDPVRNITDAHFSPDSAWVAFTAAGRIFIAPFPAGKPWIEASATPGMIAEWAPDGGALYFLSEADGFLCLWVQRLDVRKEPVGRAAAVRHFHRFTLSPWDLPHRHQRFAVARDKVVLSLRRMTGNLFVAR